MDLSQLLAREAVRDLVARYNAYGDSGLFDRMIGLFTRDATLELAERTYVGHDEIRSVFESVPERSSEGGTRPPAYLRHCTSTHQIDLVDEDGATGRCYFFVLTGIGLDHWGRYLDDYRRVDGAWRFARRRVLIDDLHPDSAFRS
jgi:hypothetical protein